MTDVRVSVELREEFLNGVRAEREHPSLVAVISRTPIAFAEGARDGDIRQFLAVAENAKLGFAAQHFASADQTRLPRLVRDAVIFDNFFLIEGKRNGALLFGHVSLS